MNNAAMLSGDHEFTSLIQALVDHTSSVIYVKDVDFRYLLINRQFENLFHVSRNEIVGKNDFDIFSTKLAEGFRANDHRVLESGKPLNCEEVAAHDDGLHRYLSLKFPLRNAQNVIYAVAGISTDITDRLRAENEIASLQNRHQLILNSVADGICGLDEIGKIVFLNPAAEQILQWKSEQLEGVNFSQIIVNRRLVPRNGDVAPLDHLSQVINGKTVVREQNAVFRRKDGSFIPVDFTMASIDFEQSPIRIVVAFRDTTERLRHLAIEQEVLTARRIQISLTPKRLPMIPGFDFAAISIPCSKACGDYYDFIPWGRNRFGIVVGDVSGHGLGAALEMVETRAVLRATMLNETDPVECLTRLNALLTDDLPEDMFVTLFLGALNVQDRTFSFSSAGHDANLLSADGSCRRLQSTGTVLGWNRTASYTCEGPIELKSGDLLLVATDGIIETLSEDRQLFGRNRLIELLQRYRAYPAHEILDAIRTSLDSFRGPEPQRDDVTAVVVRVL